MYNVLSMLKTDTNLTAKFLFERHFRLSCISLENGVFMKDNLCSKLVFFKYILGIDGAHRFFKLLNLDLCNIYSVFDVLFILKIGILYRISAFHFSEG